MWTTSLVVWCVLITLFAALCCTGIFINAVLLVVFAKHPEIRTPENVLLINLCVSDIAYLLSFCITMIASFTSSNSSCLIVTFCRSFLIAANVYSVVAISIQRYVGLKSLKIRLPVDKTDYRNSLLILAAVWIIAALLAAIEVPLIMHKTSEEYFNCFLLVFTGKSVYRMLVYAVIPSVVIAVFYIAAAWRVNRSVQQITNVHNNAAFQTLRDRRKRSARILFALAMVFASTYLPLFLFLYVGDIYSELLHKLHVSLLTYIMSILNPIFNLIALYLSSTQLRQLYKTHCCCCYYCCCKQMRAAPPNQPH